MCYSARLRGPSSRCLLTLRCLLNPHFPPSPRCLHSPHFRLILHCCRLKMTYLFLLNENGFIQ
jgi:hypothetical protein